MAASARPQPHAPPTCRGVFRAPYDGPSGEAVLIAVDARNRLVLERLVPLADLDREFDAMTSYLTRSDPVPALRLV